MARAASPGLYPMRHSAIGALLELRKMAPSLGCGYNRGGNSFQISASKTKLMSLNASKFAFIYFHFLFRIEPFQRVAREKIEKLLLRPGSRGRLWANVSNSHGFSPSRPSTGERERDSAKRNTLHIFLILSKKFAEDLWLSWRWRLASSPRLRRSAYVVIAIPGLDPGQDPGSSR
jgi:hypothetical protein